MIRGGRERDGIQKEKRLKKLKSCSPVAELTAAKGEKAVSHMGSDGSHLIMFSKEGVKR